MVSRLGLWFGCMVMLASGINLWLQQPNEYGFVCLPAAEKHTDECFNYGYDTCTETHGHNGYSGT